MDPSLHNTENNKTAAVAEYQGRFLGHGKRTECNISGTDEDLAPLTLSHVLDDMYPTTALCTSMDPPRHRLTPGFIVHTRVYF